MLFCSSNFIFCFLPLVLVGYYGLHALGLRSEVKNLFLIAASLIFFGWVQPWSVPLLLAMSSVTWICGRALAHGENAASKSRLPLVVLVFAGVATLAVFKAAPSASEAWPDSILSRVILPVGFSFLLFQCIAYGVDVHRGQTRPANSFVELLTFTVLFPRVMAGPVLRFADFASELRERTHSIDQVALGLTRFSFGLAKKVLLADPLGAMADAAFAADAGSLGTFSSWMGIMAFAFQIYFDLSAYADMAIGVARMFGFTFPENMESPYRSIGIGDFWQRWHITVSQFFRDCVFIPVGGNRGSAALTMFSVMLTALIGALWHGGTAGLLIWGTLHGALVILGRLKFVGSATDHLPKVMRIAFTFILLLVAWVFFRAASVPEALRYLAIMFCQGPALTPAAAFLDADMLRNFNTLTLVAAMIGTWVVPNTQTILRRFLWWKALIGLVLFVISAAMMAARGASPFIYFQF